jgi:hypothetical protein
MYLGESIGLSCVKIFIHGIFSSGLSGSELKCSLNRSFAVFSSLTNVVIISSADCSHQSSQSVSSQLSVSSQWRISESFASMMLQSTL